MVLFKDGQERGRGWEEGQEEGRGWVGSVPGSGV